MNTTHITNRPFKHWSAEEEATWSALAQRQLDNGEGKLSQIFFKGIQELGITADQFPDLAQVSHTLQQLTDWELVSTNLEFADGQNWFELLKQNQFLVTEYIRPANSLEHTPKPDVFHDLFGHVPFLVDPQLSRIIRKFTALILERSGEKRKRLSHRWWYTIEFGLVRESGELRAFGAGLASSFGELNNVFQGNTKLIGFTVAEFSQTKESPTAFHPVLFVLDSLDQLENILDTWPEPARDTVQ